MNRKTESYVNKPLTCTKITTEKRIVQVRKQVAFCPSCRCELEATEFKHPKFCQGCGKAINWQGFTWISDEVIKLFPVEDDSNG